MTPERMKEIRERLQMTGVGLSRLMGRASSTVKLMERGDRVVPVAVGDWLLALDEWVRQNPPPPKTR